MSISIDDVHHIAALARLAISAERATAVVGELNTILSHMQVLSATDTAGVQEAIGVGARVKHRKFGSGVIAELAGSGRDLKAKIDFDDESIGRKTLVVAQANLERDID